MSKATSCKDAIVNFCNTLPEQPKPEDIVECNIFYEQPSIERMDPSLSMLKSCKKLSMSSNNIEKIAYLNGLQLEILSLGRNLIRKLDGVEAVKDTLQELWISYNQIDKLSVLVNYPFPKLRKIFACCNNIASWAEVEALAKIDTLEEVALAGNSLPNYTQQEVFARLPRLLRVDGWSMEMLSRKAGAAVGPTPADDLKKE
ncbi:Dynein_light chain [Hexamita inflata]|uniref:Dynein light chain n=1 Tax=Hexamita inflata TaxID=28002 RepID=A0AA86UW84_9EUKA|nr:Dynein light chain [Hexamita inflata]